MRMVLIAMALLMTSAFAEAKGKWEVTKQERNCLYKNAFFEGATDHPITHQGFIEVVLNRRSHADYPNDVCKVIYQDKAFSWTLRDRWVHVNESHAYAVIQILVDGILDGLKNGKLRPITFGATHYHATYVEPCWLPDMKRTNKLGHHIFYKQTQKTGACTRKHKATLALIEEGL